MVAPAVKREAVISRHHAAQRRRVPRLLAAQPCGQRLEARDDGVQLRRQQRHRARDGALARLHRDAVQQIEARAGPHHFPMVRGQIVQERDVLAGQLPQLPQHRRAHLRRRGLRVVPQFHHVHHRVHARVQPPQRLARRASVQTEMARSARPGAGSARSRTRSLSRPADPSPSACSVEMERSHRSLRAAPLVPLCPHETC